MAADTVSGYIQGLLAGVEFKRTTYVLDRSARREALSRYIAQSGAAQAAASQPWGFGRLMRRLHLSFKIDFCETVM